MPPFFQAVPAPIRLQDCPDSGILWAESIQMAPRPARKSRSGEPQAPGGTLVAGMRQELSMRAPGGPCSTLQQRCSVRAHSPSLPALPLLPALTLMPRLVPRPSSLPPAVDALKKCNDNPYVVAAVANLFWQASHAGPGWNPSAAAVA